MRRSVSSILLFYQFSLAGAGAVAIVVAAGGVATGAVGCCWCCWCYCC